MDKYMGEGSYPKWGTHTVAIELQSGQHKGTIHYLQGGNCIGGSILKGAIDWIEDREMEPLFEEDEKFYYRENGEIVGFRLYPDNPEDDEDYCIIDMDLDELVVGVRIVSWEEEKR